MTKIVTRLPGRPARSPAIVQRFLSGLAFSVWLVEACSTAASAAPPQSPQLLTLAADSRLHLEVGPSTVVMGNGGYQPYLFCSAQGTLFCQAQLDEEPFHTKNKPVYHVRIGTVISRDHGLSWTPWTKEKNHDDVFIEGGACQCADGSILMLDTYVVPGSQPGSGIGELWKSADDLRTLQGPINVPFDLPHIVYGASTDDMAVPVKSARLHRSIIELPNGDLLTLMYHSFEGDTAPAAYLPTMKKTRVVVIRSRDHGATWSYLATVGVDSGVGTEGYGEPVLARVDRSPHTGRLLSLIRTGRDLYGTHSDDNGQTWASPVPVKFPGVDVYDTAQWANLFVDTKSPDYIPSSDMIGAIVDPELIQMKNGVLVCAFGARMPGRKATEGFGRSFLKTVDGKTPDLRPIAGRRYDTWRAERNGNYLAFSFDGGDTWSEVVQYRSGLPTTHYAGVREISDGLLYIVYDNSLPKERQPPDVVHEAIGFQLRARTAQ